MTYYDTTILKQLRLTISVLDAGKSHNEWVSMGADLVRISKIGNLLEHFPRFTYQISALWSEHRIVLFSPSRYLVISAFKFFEHIGWGNQTTIIDKLFHLPPKSRKHCLRITILEINESAGIDAVSAGVHRSIAVRYPDPANKPATSSRSSSRIDR